MAERVACRPRTPVALECPQPSDRTREEAPITPSSSKQKAKRRTVDTRSPEAREIAREFATLALAWVDRKGKLLVRQREELRRALATTADLQGWILLTDRQEEIASKDFTTLTRSGARALAKDLADELAAKKAELTQLKKDVKAFDKLAETGDFDEPIEVEYTHTVRKPSKGLITRTEVEELKSASDASDLARTIEKRLDAWGKLREEMLGELKKREKRLDEMKDSIPDFVDASSGLIRDVFATLY
ncbi:MAG: hypothetical protein R3195_02300 [Gemmatimonadota bacterium]|nr:hypothetical protein [Gemmatimonadota bacterium]